MSDADIISIITKALVLAGKLGGPFLISILVVGVLVSLFQAVFQIPDQTLTFVPKILVAVAVILLGGTWMLHTSADFVITLWSSIPDLLRSKG